MERRKVRRRDADLFVEDETELFRDALRAGQTQKVKEMLAEVAEPRTQLEKKPAILCKCAYE
jgi:hypothetical protein